MMRQTELVERVAQYLPDADEDLLNRAYVYAMHKHRHQTRELGDPYFSHPLEVAAIVTDLRLDQHSVVAALLHDTIEDTDATRREIDSMFGSDIGQLVDGLTKLKNIELVSKKTRQGENLRRLLLAVAEDVRVLLVKLADRLHNMRTLDHVKPEKRARVAQETMDIYAPLAARMGMQTMREELEDRAFRALYPEAQALILSKLDALSETSSKLIAEIETSIVDNLGKRGITATVKSRTKRPNSIYRKMEHNQVSFEQLSDLIGFRVVVDSVEDCYTALGIIHGRWPAVPGRFKDYISTPKQNDYRSLHTTIAGPSHQRVELQIRTHAMHEIAEFGIAAHALYKDGVYSSPTDPKDTSGSRAYAWLRRTVETLSENDHPDDVLEHARLELFNEQVFCFTPKGRLIALPQGATAIDFAYAVHTNVGNDCVGCRINGRAAQVMTVLKNGDEVLVIRQDGHIPQPSWEKFAVTGKARAGIRRATRTALMKQYRANGTRMLTSAFRKAGQEFDEKKVKNVLPKLARRSVLDAISAVGRGELPAEDVLRAVYPDYRKDRTATLKPGATDGWFSMTGVANFVFRIPGRKRRQERAAKAEDSGSMPFSGIDPATAVRIDPMSGAVPGDRIVGIVDPGHGIVVYPIEADGLSAFEDTADEWIDLRWDIDEENPARFPARIGVTALDAPGTLAEITDIMAKADANIDNLYLTSPDSGLSRMVFGVEVWDLKHLSRLMREIRALSVVTVVERVYG